MCDDSRYNTSQFFLYCSLRGFWRGTVNEAFSIVGIFIGLIIASAYYADVSQYLFNWVINKEISHMSGYLVYFSIIYLIINCLGILVTYIFHLKNRGWGSHLSGGLVGSIKGILLVSVLTIPLIIFLPKGSNFIKYFTLLSLEIPISEQMTHVISKEMQKTFSAKINDYKNSWVHQSKSSPSSILRLAMSKN